MAGKVPVNIEEHLRRRAGVSEDTPGVFKTITNAVSGLVQGGINAGTASSVPGPIPLRSMMPPTTETSDAIAGAITPQSTLEAGVMAGTMGAGGLVGKAGLTGLKAGVTRLGGGIAGGEIGNLAQGGSLGEGALAGGVTGLLGESVGWGVGKIMRSAPGARAKINATEWDAMAEEVGKYVPGLFKAKNPSELKRKVLSGEIQDELGNRYAQGLDDVSALIGGNRVNAPTLFPVPMPLEDAVKKLSEMGYAGFGGTKSIPIRRTMAGKGQREDWQVGLDEIRSELNRFNPTGEAAALFDVKRNEYAVGKTLEDILRQPGTWHGGPKTVEVDFNRLREAYEQQLSKFTNMLTPTDIQAVEKVLYRGGQFGGRDLMPTGFGHAGDAAAQLARSGGGTGTVGVLAPRTALPGLGAQYTGQPPMSSPNLLQTGLDVAASKGLGGFLNPLLQRFGAPGLPE